MYSQYVHLVSGSICHPDKTPNRVGDTIRQGEQIGMTGKTDNVTGTALHFGLGTQTDDSGKLTYKVGRIDPRPLDCPAMHEAISSSNATHGIDKTLIHSQIGLLYKILMDD